MRRHASNLALALMILLATASGSLMIATESCTPKVNQTVFTGPARASDDIASSIKILVRAESDLEQQKPPLLTATEGLKIIDGISALNAANIQFNTDLAAAKASGNKSALKPSYDALKKAVNDLNANGVLGIKSDKAKQIFSTTMGAVSLALAALEAFTTNP